MSLKDNLLNIKSVFKEKISFLIFFISSGFILFLLFYFTHLENIYYNMGKIYFFSQITSQLLLGVFFGLNITMLWHKLKFSAEFSKKDANTTTVGSVLALLVSGCPACGITVASYLGLATVFSALPLYGLELKIFGLGLLIYSTNNLAKNMYVCEIKD